MKNENYNGRELDKNRPSNNPYYPELKVAQKKFETAEELQDKIDAYFFALDNNTKEVMSASGVIKMIADPLMPTIEDFSSYLGFKSTNSLLNYGALPGYEIFHDAIATARAKILGRKTKGLVNGKGSATGLIFDLVNNHGYKNKSEVESDNRNEHIITVKYD